MEIMKITSKETRENIINDMTYLTNVIYVGVKGFNTTSSAILGSTKKTLRVKYFLESTVVGSVRENKEGDTADLTNNINMIYKTGI